MTRLTDRPRTFFGIRLPSLSQGSFGRNQLFVISQRVVAMLIQVLFAPIITRIYAPEAYGVTSAVISIASVFPAFFTLAYDRAILLAQDEREAQALRRVANLLSTGCSAVLMAILLFGGDRLLTAVGLPALGRMALLIPVLTAVLSWATVSRQMVAYYMRYKDSFIYESIGAAGGKIYAVAHGLMSGGAALGLILSEIFLRAGQWFFNRCVILRDRFRWRPRGGSAQPFREVMRKYASFPKFELPAALLTQASMRIPLFWIPAQYGMFAFGSYGLSISLLEAPLSLLSNSMSQTFYQKAARTYHHEGAKRVRSITLRSMGFMAITGLIPTIILASFAPLIFAVFFGPKWEMAGHIAQVLAVMFYARLVLEPVMSVLRVIGKQKAYVSFNALILLLRLMAVGASILLSQELLQALFLFVLADVVGRAFFTLRIVAYLNHMLHPAKVQE